MTNVVTIGGFDDIRSHDIRFLEEAAKWGPLTVHLLPDCAFAAVKFPAAERAYILRALKAVAAVTEDAAARPQPGTILAARETEASVADERQAADSGLVYRVIAESALVGFPAVPPTPAHAGKTVAVSGCYDWLHSGHVRLFEDAAGLGALHVFLGSDATIGALKGPGHPQFPGAERRYVVASVRHVFHAAISAGSGMLDFAAELETLRPDAFVVNEDGDRPDKKNLCHALGIDYRVLKREAAPGLPPRSSTMLRGF